MARARKATKRTKKEEVEEVEEVEPVGAEAPQEEEAVVAPESTPHPRARADKIPPVGTPLGIDADGNRLVQGYGGEVKSFPPA